ncbi:phosphatase PAP2 family protein [Pollutibacter soli]|uniref:phosphatase PAP2 family protein n=1 Tax=Pollutibacter soli TaxID=3034157 RepID=UPI003014130B
MKFRCLVLFSIVIIQQQALNGQSIDSLEINYRLKFSNEQLAIPVGLIASGLITNRNKSESLKNEIVEERNKHLAKFHTPVDNYLQFAPYAIAYGLDFAGIKSKTDISNRTAIMIKSELLMMGTVSLLKYSTAQLRPDGTAHNSFPSGHTAQAFAAATFLSEEYKHRFKWMPYVSYGIASGVGLLRMANNRHYISDVLLGAGIGILTTKVTYWTHQYKWGRKNAEPPKF